jgi:hypothetical protein
MTLPASQPSPVDDDGFSQRPLAVRVRHIAGQQVGHLVDADSGDWALVIWHDGQPANWCRKQLLRFATTGSDGRTPLSPPGTAAAPMLRGLLGGGAAELRDDPSPQDDEPRRSSSAGGAEPDPNQLTFDGL